MHVQFEPEPMLQTRLRFKCKSRIGKNLVCKKIPFMPETALQGYFNGPRGPWDGSVSPEHVLCWSSRPLIHLGNF